MKLASAVCVTVAIAGVVGLPVARADQTATSTISQIKVLSPSDSRYRLFHGAVWLQVDKATQNYRWGGKHCAGGGLSESSLALLFAAFSAKHSVTIDYDVRRYRKQISRCITGFTVAR